MTGGNKEDCLLKMIEMVNGMAKLDFSHRMDVELSNKPEHILAHGLNMLSEELEHNVIQRAALEEINKNLESYSYTLAHDIRSPLNNASNLLAFIEEDMKKTESKELFEYVMLLKEIIERTKNMVNGILEYSKSGARTDYMEAINLNNVCGQLAKDYVISKNVEIITTTTLPTIQYNPTAILQIFSNLIHNAVKFNDKEKCLIRIHAEEQEHEHVISIQDNGPGIAKESLPKIFDLFVHGNKINSDSSGIGLAVVKKIILENNGHIWATSEENHGATFFFTIPKIRTY